MRVPPSVVAGVTLAVVLTGCASGLPQSSDDAPAGAVTLFDLELGDCLNDAGLPLRSDMTDVPRVDCEDAHDSELFAILGAEGSAFPGE